MPAFGLNRFAVSFCEAILQKPVQGFRLSDRVISAVDTLYADLVRRFASTTYPGMSRYVFVYPFVGARDWTHSMNMADLDGGFTKYSILWSGTTHNELGIFGGQGNTQADCGSANGGPQDENWVGKSFGFYCRTNSVANEACMQAQTPVQPNGYTYQQHILPRNTDGNVYFRNAFFVGPSNGGNSVQGACGQSHGLFVDSKQPAGNDHRGTLNGQQFWGVDTGPSIGMGYGTGGAMMYITAGSRNLAFVFSTKHNCAFSPTEVADFYLFVQRFQVAMQRAV